jgi:hypothetical protein
MNPEHLKRNNWAPNTEQVMTEHERINMILMNTYKHSQAPGSSPILTCLFFCWLKQ